MVEADDASTRTQARRTDWLVGLATFGTAVIGAISLLVAVFAVFAGQLQAAGVCLIAAALAFGALANAVLRT
jgi:hypothetical protein